MDRPCSVIFASRHQWTPVHQAAKEGHVDTVKFLVEKGANIRTKDGYGVSKRECTTECGLVLLIRVSLVSIHLTRVRYVLVLLITSILEITKIINWSDCNSDKLIQLVHLHICTASVTLLHHIPESV